MPSRRRQWLPQLQLGEKILVLFLDKVVDTPVVCNVVELIVVCQCHRSWRNRESDTAFAMWRRSWHRATDHGNNNNDDDDDNDKNNDNDNDNDNNNDNDNDNKAQVVVGKRRLEPNGLSFRGKSPRSLVPPGMGGQL